MKILIVMTGFFPGKKFGGPPVSVDNFCALMEDHECYIVTRNHDMGDNKVYLNIKEGWNDRGNCKVLYLSDREYGYAQYEEVIIEIKPDIIYLQGLFQNCIIPCLFLAKKHDISVMLAPRGELCKGAFKKKYKKIPYIYFLKIFGLIKNIRFQSTSEEETEAISQILRVNKERIFNLSNIPSIPKKKYEYKHKYEKKANFIFLSRIVPKKNLDYALECLKNISGSVNFDIYGAIEDKEYWYKCKKIIDILPDNIKVTYKGCIEHDSVHETFSQYDAFFFPTQSENFGHVIVESMGVGCPIIISNQVPWVDVQEHGAGWSISLDNPKKYVEVIQHICDIGNEEEMILREFAKQYFKCKLNLTLLKASYERAFEKE